MLTPIIAQGSLTTTTARNLRRLTSGVFLPRGSHKSDTFCIPHLNEEVLTAP